MPTRTKSDVEFEHGENKTVLALSELADEYGIGPVMSGCARFLYQMTREREKDAWDRHAEREGETNESGDEPEH